MTLPPPRPPTERLLKAVEEFYEEDKEDKRNQWVRKVTGIDQVNFHEANFWFMILQINQSNIFTDFSKFLYCNMQAAFAAYT